MHIHILGICGTFMGGIAVLAKQAGFRVTGCDANVYPPMSTQLQEQGIELIQGFGVEQTSLSPDVYVIGNVVTRGNPLMEEILNKNYRYISGPQWLSETILKDKWVLAVAGTHGKTTTTSMLAWILEYAGYNPGFLIGGVPMNFGISARLHGKEDTDFFVIEADEYDTAFFDKRSKFVHYHPRTAILNNLEFDHADIFPDIAAIETQFHHLIRTVPQIGQLIINQQEASLQNVLQKGCWSEKTFFAHRDKTIADNTPNEKNDWTYHVIDENSEFNVWEIAYRNQIYGNLKWSVMGEHNKMNALAAIAAAKHVGVLPSVAIEALAQFQNVKRRMEKVGEVNQITIYDDFAHHPTAIETTIAGLRKKVGQQRILAVLEPRSNTMKMGVVKQALPSSLNEANVIFAYGASSGKDALGWDLAECLTPISSKAKAYHDLDKLVQDIAHEAQPNDHILVMSNGGFAGVHQKIHLALQQKFALYC